MAAAFSTPMPRIPMRIRTPSPICWRFGLILVIPFASVFAFGRAVLDFRQGRAIAIAMGIVLVAGVAVAYWAESSGNPLLTAIGVDAAARQYGRQRSALWSRHERALCNGDHWHQHRLSELDA